MTSTSPDLLGLLASRAMPGLAPGTASAPPAAAGLDFGKMLLDAESGKLHSGREVTIAKGAGLKLSDDQVKRISAAADIAESQGATRALVMIDGMAVKLDVGMREVTGAIDLKQAGVLTGIDAVVDVPPTGGATAAQDPASEAALLLKKLSGRGTPRAA